MSSRPGKHTPAGLGWQGIHIALRQAAGLRFAGGQFPAEFGRIVPINIGGRIIVAFLDILLTAKATFPSRT